MLLQLLNICMKTTKRNSSLFLITICTVKTLQVIVILNSWESIGNKCLKLMIFDTLIFASQFFIEHMTNKINYIFELIKKFAILTQRL